MAIFVWFIDPSTIRYYFKSSSVVLKVISNFIYRQVKQVSFKHILSCQPPIQDDGKHFHLCSTTSRAMLSLHTALLLAVVWKFPYIYIHTLTTLPLKARGQIIMNNRVFNSKEIWHLCKMNWSNLLEKNCFKSSNWHSKAVNAQWVPVVF